MANPFDQQKPLEGIKNILLVGSGKGGVGKSTVSLNLALGLKNKGYSVGLLDGDLYGPSLSKMLGIDTSKPPDLKGEKIYPPQRHGLKLMSLGLLVPENQAVIWRGPMLFKAVEQFFKRCFVGRAGLPDRRSPSWHRRHSFNCRSKSACARKPCGHHTSKPFSFRCKKKL